MMGKDKEKGKRSRRFADPFYSSHVWERCRKAYAQKMIYCERCLKAGRVVPGEHVHHKVRLTPENIRDPSITLNFDNLELLCVQCHLEEHAKRRYRADRDGHIEL